MTNAYLQSIIDLERIQTILVKSAVFLEPDSRFIPQLHGDQTSKPLGGR